MFTSLIKLITSFLIDIKFKIIVEREFSAPREIMAGMPQGSTLVPIVYSLYVNDTPAAPENHLTLFTDDSYI
jgi:hypothetical protein